MAKDEKLAEFILEDVQDIILHKDIPCVYLDAIDNLLFIAEKFNTNENIQKILASLIMNKESYDYTTGESNMKPYKKGLSNMSKYLTAQRSLPK